MWYVTADMEIMRDVKERMCYTAQNYNVEVVKTSKSPSEHDEYYELPDGCLLQLGVERFRCPEALFQPSYLGQ